jgi:hypothetical protein
MSFMYGEEPQDFDYLMRRLARSPKTRGYRGAPWVPLQGCSWFIVTKPRHIAYITLTSYIDYGTDKKEQLS